MSKDSLKSNPFVMLIDEVSRMKGRVSSLYANVHEESGLKQMEDLVLNAIAEADHPPSVSQIGRSLGHPRQVIQRAVNDLIDDGCVEKLPNPTHRSVPLLALTARGVKLKERTNELALSITDAFLQRVDPERCRTLALELRAMRREIEAFARETDSNS